MTASVTMRASATSDEQTARVRAAVTRLVGDGGYLNAKIEEIAPEARISCTTFYDLYGDKEACFLDAHASLAAELRERFAHALNRVEPESATRASLGALVGFALERPQAFAVLGHEALVAGPSAVASRAGLLDALSLALDEAVTDTNGTARVPDIPSRVLIGGWIRALAMSLRRAVPAPDALVEDLDTWALAYDVPARARRYASALEDAARARRRPAPVQVEPAPVPRGRHGLSPSLIARVQRERLIFATAAAVHSRGYERTSVADIVATAGVSREVFYTQFASKRDAYAAALRLFLESSVGALAGVYFAPSTGWSEQLWHTLGALLEFFAAHASFARAALVETYAIDAKGTLTDDFVMGFATFLHGGWTPPAEPPSPAQSAAMIGAALEAIGIWVAAERAEQLVHLRPLIAYTLLAPLAGAREAGDFVQSRA